MIEPMLQLTVVCLKADQQAAIEQLRSLGSVHVVPTRPPESADLVRLHTAHEQLVRATNSLLACKRDPAENAIPPSFATPEALAAQLLELHTEQLKLEEEKGRLQRVRQQLEPWGDFDLTLVGKLRAGGLDAALYVTQDATALPLPEGAAVQVVNTVKGLQHALVVAPLGSDLPPGAMAWPELGTTEELDQRQVVLAARMEAIGQEQATLKAHLPQLQVEQAHIENEIAFAAARDGMGDSGELAYLQGYVPSRRLTVLAEAAQRHGWAVRSAAASMADPEVPVSLRVPKLFKMSKAIFDFLNIVPAYNENDVSISVLLFLSVFFGIIVGDAGYGLIFLGATLFAKGKFKKPATQPALNLMILMSSVTIFWGWLSGSWFALPTSLFPRFMQGIDWLTDPATKDQNVQWLCFLIAAIHLSLARFWLALVNLKNRTCLGHVGWAALIWANFFLAAAMIAGRAFPATLAYSLYGGGVLLVLACGVNWKDIGEVLNLPFGFIGSFVDVLSYIRLFAVGLSGFFIAQTFNNMAHDLAAATPWLWLPAILVAVFGHTLNIALAAMGVLVHGVRLNTLEFSNHMGLTWSGRKYRPLCKHPQS